MDNVSMSSVMKAPAIDRNVISPPPSSPRSIVGRCDVGPTLVQQPGVIGVAGGSALGSEQKLVDEARELAPPLGPALEVALARFRDPVVLRFPVALGLLPDPLDETLM